MFGQAVQDGGEGEVPVGKKGLAEHGADYSNNKTPLS